MRVEFSKTCPIRFSWVGFIHRWSFFGCNTGVHRGVRRRWRPCVPDIDLPWSLITGRHDWKRWYRGRWERWRRWRGHPYVRCGSHSPRLCNPCCPNRPNDPADHSASPSPATISSADNRSSHLWLWYHRLLVQWLQHSFQRRQRISATHFSWTSGAKRCTGWSNEPFVFYSSPRPHVHYSRFKLLILKCIQYYLDIFFEFIKLNHKQRSHSQILESVDCRHTQKFFCWKPSTLEKCHKILNVRSTYFFISNSSRSMYFKYKDFTLASFDCFNNNRTVGKGVNIE